MCVCVGGGEGKEREKGEGEKGLDAAMRARRQMDIEREAGGEGGRGGCGGKRRRWGSPVKSEARR